MRPFEYVRADDVASAVALVSADPRAEYLAGGTTELEGGSEGHRAPASPRFVHPDHDRITVVGGFDHLDHDMGGVDREHRILPLFGLLLDDDGLGALLASEGEWRQFRLLTLE